MGHSDQLAVGAGSSKLRDYLQLTKPSLNIMVVFSSVICYLMKLSEDIVLLSLEKDPNRKFFLEGKLELILVIFVILAIGLVLLFTFLKKDKPSYEP